jgi:phosphotransferase system  glucose/maltose/N-acetylglucosamine-specific IIC component
MLVADLAAYVVVIVVTAAVVVAVLGAFVWAAIQDGRDEDARRRKS